MRADRLVRLMMLLQARSQATVGELARELEVSERTVHRDLDALSGSGVPVVVTRGVNGGVSLMPGWQTKLTGFTRAEIHALAAVGAPGALDDLGLASPLRSGLLKLAASLPALQQPVMEYARQRIHIDASGWFTEREPAKHLAVLREAVWQDRRIRIDYRDFDGKQTRRVVDPYGLVVKNDQWYLVAGSAKGPTVFRSSRIEGAKLLEETFVRPDGFDLAAFWQEWRAAFHQQRAKYEVTLKLTSDAEQALAAQRPPSDRARMEAAERGSDGTKSVVIDFERESIAVSQICSIGFGIEVLAPETLREKLRRIGEALISAHCSAANEVKGANSLG